MGRKVNWGVLGTAGIAYGQTIPGMQKADNCNLYAIAGRSLEKAKSFQDTFGFEKAYGSYEELLADPAVEAVYLPLPNHIHYTWIEKAAKAGKHILCEKPMCMNGEELAKAFAVCRENGVILMEAYAYLHNDAIKAMMGQIHNDAIGELRMIEACFFTGGPKQTDYRWTKQYGGGAVYDLGCYSVSFAQRIMEAMPEDIQTISHFADTGVDDYCHIYMRYPSGVIASLGCGFCARGRSDRMVIHGTKGTLWADIVFNQEGRCEYDIHTDTGSEHFAYEVKTNYALEVEQLGRCITEGEKPYVSEQFSKDVMTILDTVLQKINY